MTIQQAVKEIKLYNIEQLDVDQIVTDGKDNYARVKYSIEYGCKYYANTDYDYVVENCEDADVVIVTDFDVEHI